MLFLFFSSDRKETPESSRVILLLLFTFFTLEIGSRILRAFM